MPLLPDLPDYEVLGRLATGGMAEIWSARARTGTLAGQPVVLKRLLPVHRGDGAYVELFLAEAKLGVLVAHPNVVRTHDLFRAGLDYFIVQELVGGETLSTLRESARQKLRRLPVGAALVAATDLLEALAYLHSGAGGRGQAAIIHRDVNPSNVVADPRGNAKLIDFGVAEIQGQPAMNRTGALRGTPAYMSPEQVKSRPLDPRSDLFSAGVLLWELLANRPLFQQDNEFETLRLVNETVAPPLRSLDATVPTGLERLLVRALTRDPDRRFQTAIEFLTELRDTARREGIPLDRKLLADEVAAVGR